jgi:capsular exopolysaccharide synthesis family protein
MSRLTQYRIIVEDIKRTMVPGSKMGTVKRQIMEAEMLQQQYDQLGKEIREQLKERKRAEAEREIKKLESQVQLLTEQEQHFQDDVEKQGREVLHVGQKSIEIEMDKDKLRNLNEVLASISAEREKLKVELNSTPRIVRLQKAELPKEEYKRAMRLLLVGVSSLFGFCLPVFGVVLWDVRSRRVNAVEEVAQGLGLSVIGSVPVIPAQILRRLGGTSRRAQTWRLRLTESIDGIAARLLRKAEMEQARVVLVSSAVAGEGKTTLATQLATSLARHGRRTVLVDFDLRQPALDEVFGVPLEPGVCEALRGNADVNGMVHPTGTEHLSVLSAGQCDRQTMAALANGAGSRLFNQLREKYDFVIIDSSPILPVADTRFVSQYADTVVLSVFRDLSEVPKIQAACEILDAFGVRHLEAVVTGGSGFSYGRGRQYATSGTV